jgi:hypothetical protein
MMSPAWTLLFSIMAAIATVSSAALLYKASLPLLHGKVSFSGQTPFEADFRATRWHGVERHPAAPYVGVIQNRSRPSDGTAGC